MSPEDAHRLYELAEFPQICEFAHIHTAAVRLDGRACAWLYGIHRAEIDWDALVPAERELIRVLGVGRP